MGKPRVTGPGVRLSVGVALVVAVCCGVPTLLAGGALGVIGGFLDKPLVIAAGVGLGGAGLLTLFLRPRKGTASAAPLEPMDASDSGDDVGG